MTLTTSILACCIGVAVGQELPQAPPEDLGFDPVILKRIEPAVMERITRGKIPGAVVLVGRRGKIAYIKALGNRTVEPISEPMTRDTVFDMASLTKPVATATSVMILWERGLLELNKPITTYLPELNNQGKEAITLNLLLRHRAGLIPDNPLSDYLEGSEEAWRRIASIDLQYTPGERFRYTDVGFIILGELVKRITGQTLDAFARENIFEPLGMESTTFRPLEHGIELERIAPTEPNDDGYFRGHVHDPRARALGGVAGHAGLFSTVDDLAIYAQTLLSKGLGPNDERILAPPTVSAMIDDGDTPEDERRGLGWDIATGFSSPRGLRFGPTSFGHTGFTGTSIWIDPATETFVILLTSRLHPGGDQPSPIALRREVATIVAEAIVDTPLPLPTPSEALDVQCGIDVLEAEGFATLRGKRVGLVTNHTGLTKDGRSTVDVLFESPDVEVVALFGPEHGIRGLYDSKVDDGRDEKTGLPVYSLYGDRRKPTTEQIQGLDTIVFDIADIGARFYTYISTLGLVMEAASATGIEVIVLDRPNPINGLDVAGPLRDKASASFIAYHALPVRHGMTVGEIAGLYNTERDINVQLTVIPCQGWSRSMFFDETGLTWINPSPNMRSLNQALLYPGVGLLEATNLATGRGTDTPFERVGAPWIDPQKWAASLNNARLSGLRFVPIQFIPEVRQHAGEECGGVYILITDRSRVEPITLGITLATTLHDLYPDDWDPEGLLRLLADQASYEAIVSGASTRSVQRTWSRELQSFLKLREQYLIYPD